MRTIAIQKETKNIRIKVHYQSGMIDTYISTVTNQLLIIIWLNKVTMEELKSLKFNNQYKGKLC